MAAASPAAGRNPSRAPRLSIRLHLTVLAAALALPLLLALAYASWTERQHSAANARRSTVELARLASAGVGQFVGESRRLMVTLAERPLLAAARPGACDPALYQVPRLNTAYANIGIVDLRGRVICSGVPLPRGRVVSVAKTAWFRRLRRTDAFTVGSPFVGPLTHRWVSVLAMPLRVQGRTTGYLALPIDLVRYQQPFSGLRLTPGGLLAIVDRAGIVVARSPDPEGSVGKPFPAAAKLRRHETFTASGPDGVRRVYSVAPLAGTSWVAIAGVPAAAVFADSDALMRNIAFFSLAALLLGSLAAALFSRAIVHPIRGLGDAAVRVSRGERDVSVRSEGPHEVAAAAAEFNRMVLARAESDAEQSRLNERLKQAEKMEAVGRLAGGVAHDFNNLLLAMRGYGELALARLEGAARSEVEEMLRAAERATALTSQLLAFSRRQVLKPEVLDLNDVVESVEKLLRRLIGEQVELVTLLAPDPVRVNADQGQLEQVITNLAVNGRDAMRNGGTLTIEVGSAHLGEQVDGLCGPGSFAVLAVSDTGTGMDAETAERIFEPFFTTKQEHGTGLGLSTVHGIVNQSGGQIYTYSEVGHGTTFKIYLPLVEGAEPAGRELGPVPSGGCGAETILLVEDDQTVRAVVCAMLRKAGYTVLTAAGGEQAIELVQRHGCTIPLVITDLVMRGLTGRETAARIRELSPSTRFLYMSGYTDDAAVRTGTLEPGTAFLQKPFGSEELGRRVRELLDGVPA